MREWPASRGVDEGSRRRSRRASSPRSLLDPQELVPPAIDQLEHVVGGAYQPGAGVARRASSNQVRAASALLTAFEITGRLPYSMLAEELMQTARRVDRRSTPSADAHSSSHCEAARVFCRLAALHDDADYRKAAVIAVGCRLSRRRRAGSSPRNRRALVDAPAAHAAAYGLALLDLLK